MDFSYLLFIAVILLSTKLLGLITRRFRMPQVVGALLAGLILGPAMLGVVTDTDFLKSTAELGVIVLMFTAGMETDISELKKNGKASFVVALMGVILPLVVGFLVAWGFNGHIPSDAEAPIMLQNIFIGVVLTATSVSITVETLKEMGKLSTKAGNTILGAAVIDDILGIIALTVITSMADSSVQIWLVCVKIVAFFVLAIGVGVLFYFLVKKWMAHYNKDLRRFVIAAFVFCLLLSYAAEEWFGVADITGAFIAGLIISRTPRAHYVASRFETLSYIFLSPIFFASIGLQVKLENMSVIIAVFAVVLVVVAILTKIGGCGLGAKLCGFSGRGAVQVGVGMISRGEVALIVATKGANVGLMSSNLYGPVIIMVVLTTIIAPIFLKIAFKKDSREELEQANELSKGIETVIDYTTTERPPKGSDENHTDQKG